MIRRGEMLADIGLGLLRDAAVIVIDFLGCIGNCGWLRFIGRMAARALLIPWNVFEWFEQRENEEEWRIGLQSGLAQGVGGVFVAALIYLCFFPFIATRAIVENSLVGESGLERDVLKYSFTAGWLVLAGILTLILWP